MTISAGAVSLCNQLFPGLLGGHGIPLAHLLHGIARWVVKFSRVCVHDVFGALPLLHRVLLQLFGGISRSVLSGAVSALISGDGGPALPGGIVDLNLRLHVVAIDVKKNSASAVFHRQSFHVDASGDGFISPKNRCHAVHHMDRVPVIRLRATASFPVSCQPIRWHRLYRLPPETLRYCTLCHPVG